MSDRPLIAVTMGQLEEARPFLDAIERSGGEPWPIAPNYALTPGDVLARAGALLLGEGPNVNPRRYKRSPDLDGDTLIFDDARDQMELTLTRAALHADLPIYGIGRGMHILNVSLGGSLVQKLEATHPSPSEEDELESARHHIYISPGSKLAAVVGSGGFVRVNSRHTSGMREAHKSPRLVASAYSLEDGLIEALESPNHRWVIAVQFSPQRRMENPPHFDRLFQSLSERAAERLSAIG